MQLDFLHEVFRTHADQEAMIWRDDPVTYGWLLERIAFWVERLANEGVEPGTVVILEADFSPNSVALFLALYERGCILVPLTSSVEASKVSFVSIAEGEWAIRLDHRDEVTFERLERTAAHSLYQQLRKAGHPGLVLFSSGSTGESKAALHDLVPLMEKFKVRRHAMRTMTFLLYDHIGGVNTMLYVLSNGGCIVTVQDRDPEAVLSTVARHRVELLPTSPTFINLILISEAYTRHDLSSLQLVTYGTEPMPESTLKRFHELLPEVKLLQTYGLSELGILRSKSKSSDSLWVKLGGEGFETRVRDGLLEIKAASAMLGYLNAESPFTEDGWFKTGDEVEQEGAYFRILGRRSEIINVGGEKVYPAEVESTLQQMQGVAEVVVRGEPNPITGNMVTARVRLKTPEERKTFALRMKQFCSGKLEPFKIPVKVELAERDQHSARFKKSRR